MPSRALRTTTAAFLVALAGPALAAPILWIDDSINRLGRVDVATGAATIVGTFSGAGFAGQTMTDIAFDPSGNLWGISFNSIFRVNTSTAAVTFVGNHGIGGGNALVFGSDGTLYAAGSGGTLYTVNTTTGAASSIGSMGFASAGDLAFNAGNLYLSSTTNQLVRVNTTTGAGVAVGPLGISSVFGLATAENGVLYATAGQNVYSVNTTTGLATLVETWNTLGAANGTAFFQEAGAPPPDQRVPEPATLALLGVALAGLGALRRRVH